MARAIAPSIYENEDIKKGILLQLFGGTRKDFKKAGRGNFRYKIGSPIPVTHLSLSLCVFKKFTEKASFEFRINKNEKQ